MSRNVLGIGSQDYKPSFLEKNDSLAFSVCGYYGLLQEL